MRLGLSDARAEDALQQSFLNAWVSLEQGTEIRELHAWLRRIVHNTALNLIRGGGQDRAVDLDPALVDTVCAAESSIAQAMSAREALGHVAALPPMQRDAMVLSAIEGRSHDEVASALGVSPIAVRGLLYRARATLRAGAAALTPAPLLNWISQVTSRLAGGVGLASGPSVAGEGFNVGRALLEGAAVVATAAVAAGAVIAHSHAHSHTRHQSPPALARVGSVSRPSIQAGALQPPVSRGASSKRSSPTAPGRGPAPAGTVRTVTAPAKRSPRRGRRWPRAPPTQRQIRMACAPQNRRSRLQRGIRVRERGCRTAHPRGIERPHRREGRFHRSGLWRQELR